MKDGSKHEGYVHWNADWFDNQPVQFPDTLIDPKILKREDWLRNQPLTLYTKIFPIDIPVKSVITSAAYVVKIDRSKIARITPVQMKYDGYNGTSLNIVSKAALKWLTTEKPNAILFLEDSGVSEDYVISFNNNIDEKKLKSIFEKEKNKQKLERMGIVVMSFGYD